MGFRDDLKLCAIWLKPRNLVSGLVENHSFFFKCSITRFLKYLFLLIGSRYISYLVWLGTNMSIL